MIPLPTKSAIPNTAIRKLGVAFRSSKLVVWFCVTTGAVIEVSIAAFATSEWEMARELYSKLQPDDVVVADSAYGTNARFGMGALSRCGCPSGSPVPYGGRPSFRAGLTANSNISLVSLLELSLFGVLLIAITLPCPLPNYPLFLSTRLMRSGLSLTQRDHALVFAPVAGYYRYVAPALDIAPGRQCRPPPTWVSLPALRPPTVPLDL